MSIFGGYSAGFKPGMMEIWAGDTAPDGFLICDGSAIDRTLYSELFSAIGTTYGAGDGTDTFNLPNGMMRLLDDTMPVNGNGMTLGLTNGSITGGLGVSSTNVLANYINLYGTPIGTGINYAGGSSTGIGITSDPTKSGVVANLSSATKIKLIIKY